MSKQAFQGVQRNAARGQVVLYQVAVMVGTPVQQGRACQAQA